MRSCTVSAPVLAITSPLTSTNYKYVAVELLTKETLYFVVESKSRTKELYTQTCVHLNRQGMVDCELFGLAIILDGEFLFVDPENKLSKYAPKGWKSSSSYGLDNAGKPTLILYFRVQFYVDTPLLLRDEVTRHHYYLQLRYNVLSRGLLHACASEEVLYLLAGYALQADLGDHAEDVHVGAYFKPSEYFPQQMSSNKEQILQNVPALHRENHGMSRSEAELQFIKESSSVEVSPLTHNSHLYRLKHKKQDVGLGSVWLAICAKGIEIYEENSSKTLTASFLWNNIGKLCFDRKKFEIRASGEKYTYYANSDEKSKHLLSLCRWTHQFSMTIQPRLSEVRKHEEEERKRFRDCYGYSRGIGQDFSTLSIKNSKDQPDQQRISVISNTSSNTTSGIVSDRVQSHDESEDDLEEAEIMINSPPAPSVESLALAHLRDIPSPVLGSDVDAIDGCTPPLISVNQKISPSSSAATPATTDGSQCSSSCSTVVVAGCGLALMKPQSSETDDRLRRRASTSSSLELGYSHTAQNSTVSDTTNASCAELDYSAQSAHTSSGIYTLRSSCDTTVAGTNACSSQTSGIYVACSTDSSTNCDTNIRDSYSILSNSSDDNVMRERSDSNAASIISGSGSFRGDGSDPSDCDPRNHITAEELSDLIVGRNTFHNIGHYPSCATISSTLDTDSDYVTLPPPPVPPRCDSESNNYVILEPTQTTLNRISTSVPDTSLHKEERNSESFKQYITQTLSQQNLKHLQFQSSRIELLSQPQKALLSQEEKSSPRVPYPRPSRPPATLPVSVEEAAARFITTKPHINILKAHTSLVNSTSSPSFASPTVQQSVTVSRSKLPLESQLHHLDVPGLHVKNFNNHSLARRKLTAFGPGSDPGAKMKATPIQSLAPVIGKNNYLDVHASRANSGSALPLYQTSVSLPSSPQSASSIPPFTTNSYQRHFSPPPPPPAMLHPRQPPPPPPSTSPALATVYTSQVTRSQIEQFQQQMYSDVDYVIYPMKDPAISKQEYMDAKQSSLIAQAASQQYPPPPYPSDYTVEKGQLMYRSTPNVASLSGGFIPISLTNSATPSVKYASNQNLSTDYFGYHSSYATPSHYSSNSLLYSAGASYSSSSSRSLRFDHLPYNEVLHVGLPSRAHSDDNILNSYEKPTSSTEKAKYRRLPPPPPPPPYNQSLPKKMQHLLAPKATSSLELKTTKIAKRNTETMLDIRTLREKSKNLDLPLISALCNDRSLLKQTNAFVLPKHPETKKTKERPLSWHVEDNKNKSGTDAKENTAALTNAISATEKPVKTPQKSGTLLSSLLSSKSSTSKRSSYLSSSSSSSKLKYPVSGLSTTQISRPQRKVSVSTHIHPSYEFSKPNSLCKQTSAKSIADMIKNKEI